MIFIISMALSHMHIDLAANQVIKSFLAVILLVDFLAIRYRIRIVAQGRLIKSHSALLRRYLNTYFLPDLIALVILLLDVAGVELSYFRLLITLKLFLLIEINGEIFYKLMGHPLTILLVKFFKLLFLCVFCTFISACGFVTIDLYYLYQGNNFYVENGLLMLTSSASLDYVNLYANF